MESKQRAKIILEQLNLCYALLHSAPKAEILNAEIATIGSECTEIPTNWIEKCFLAHRKESGYIPKVSDLLKVWHGSLRVEEFNERALQAPKPGTGHDCPYCMVVAERLARFAGKAGNDGILLEDEKRRLGLYPTVSEVKCWVICLASLTDSQFSIAIEHWGDRNPYGIKSMDIRRGRDFIRSGRDWTPSRSAGDYKQWTEL